MFRIILVLAFVAFSAWAEAVVAPSGKGENMFPSEKECINALSSTGNYIIYQPKYFDHKADKSVDGVGRVNMPLPKTACVHMWTRNKWQWVVQSAGTAMRAEKKKDGTLLIYARDDCGNKIKAIAYPPDSPKPTAEVRVPPKKEEPPAGKREIFVRAEPQPVEYYEEVVIYQESHHYSPPIYSGGYHDGYRVGHHSPPIYAGSFGGIVSGTPGTRVRPGHTGPIYVGCCSGIASGTPGVGINPGRTGPIYGGCGSGCGATGRRR